MVFDLKLYERLLCGAQQKLVTKHWELPEDKSKTIKSRITNCGILT